MASDVTKLQRLYIDRNLAPNATFMLETAASHYVKNVMRMKQGDFIRLFNGHDGEWLATITAVNKNDVSVQIKGKTREQAAKTAEIHLLFAPIKKDAMDTIVQKAVELGVTDLHPVLTHRTEVRKINDERLKAQMQEAAEQCERLDVPTLHPLTDLTGKIGTWPTSLPILWCRERGESPHIGTFQEKNWAFLIGPEGGFDDAEFAFLGGLTSVKPLTLGETILRAETAVILALGYAKILSGK